MANTKHLTILDKGVEVWNNWRINVPDIKPDLSGASLKTEHIEKVNFSNTNL